MKIIFNPIKNLIIVNFMYKIQIVIKMFFNNHKY